MDQFDGNVAGTQKCYIFFFISATFSDIFVNKNIVKCIICVQGDRVPGADQHARVLRGRVLQGRAAGGGARTLHTGGGDERRRARAQLRAR